MFTKNSILVIVAIVTLNTGCVSTQVSSFKDPDFQRKKYNKIMVYATVSDLVLRERIEKEFSQNINWLLSTGPVIGYRKYSVNCLNSIDLIMPTRTYTEKEIVDILSQNYIEGVVIFSLTNYYEKQRYVPGTTFSFGQIGLSGNTADFSSTSISTGGHPVSEPRVQFEIKLYDVASGKIAWVANSVTKGVSESDVYDLVGNLTSNIISELRKADVFVEKQ